jgi:branched-chain amino acid transport system ATP-binding protein
MSEYVLEATGISKRFGGVVALRDVDVRQRHGETLGMIGPNGSGKSTFVNVLTGHLRANGGIMRLDGLPIDGKKPFQVANAGLTRTYQAVRVFGQLSVRRNIEVAEVDAVNPLKGEARAALADHLAIAHRMDVLAGSLKLDEQRRLELMMRLVQQPKLVMLDEPVGGLSAPEVNAMIRLLGELKQTCSLFVIEHSMRVIRELADKVVVLMTGEKLVEGPPADILKDRRVIEHYLGAADA